MLNSQITDQYEWRNPNSPKRLEFLNLYANQRKLFPNILDVDEFYTKFNLHRKRSINEVNNFRALINQNKIKIEGLENIDLKNPSFFYAFRYGSMMLIPFLLKYFGVELDFIAGNSSMKKKERFLNASKNADLGFGAEDIVIGDSLVGSYKIFKDKKLGKSFFCSADVGVGMSKNEKNKFVQVEINNNKINSRFGPAFLAHRMKIPFIGVWSVRKGDVIHIYFDRLKYVEDPIQSTKEIWEKKFNTIVNKDPSQWESLHYVHKHFVSVEDAVNETNLNLKEFYMFNFLRFHFIIREQEYFLFDTANWKTIKVKSHLFELLDSLNEEKGNLSYSDCVSLFSSELFLQLRNLKILI